MRLTDLLDATVLDPQGRAIGHVHDVRLVQDGPPIGTAGASLRIDGLVIGGTKFGSRLGFSRTQVRGPWLLKRFFLRLQADERLAPWADVRSVAEGEIRLRVIRDELRPPPPLP